MKKMKNKEETKEEEKKEKKEKKKSPKKKKEKELLALPSHFIIVAADLSLYRPGFCVLEIQNGRVKKVDLSSLDNKSSKKPHGAILEEIVDMMPIPDDTDAPVYFVREHGFITKGAYAQMTKNKVVGIVDYAIWKYRKKTWYELYPTTTKKAVTGSAKAMKEEVAEGLTKFLGRQAYSNDDESDAAAVAVAFLLQNGFVFPKESDAHEQNPEQE